MSYRKYFDPETTFMRGIGTDGKFREPFNPFSADHRQDDYTEGNAWQYTWLVPHDVHGLVKLFGSERRFTQKLDSLFIVTGDLGAGASPDITGLIGQYAHGNEPSHQVRYILSSMGLYQVEPAGGRYIIGSPLFNKATMQVSGGKTFTIVATDNSKENIYVQSAKLNGKRYTKSYILYDDIRKGGVLELQMGNKPSAWGTKSADRP